MSLTTVIVLGIGYWFYSGWRTVPDTNRKIVHGCNTGGLDGCSRNYPSFLPVVPVPWNHSIGNLPSSIHYARKNVYDDCSFEKRCYQWTFDIHFTAVYGYFRSVGSNANF